jgi:hypothetical protein
MIWFKENWFKLGLLSVMLIIAGSFFYYLVILPQQKEEAKRAADLRAKLEQEVEVNIKNKEQQDRDTARLWCLTAANSRSSELEEINGRKNSSGGYNVDLDVRAWIDRTIQADKDECFKKYPVSK